MTRKILAIDPGEKESGVVLFDAGSNRVISSCVVDNKHVSILFMVESYDDVAIEMIASYGMPVGREVFETCVWIGRFMECAERPDDVKLICRRDVKSKLCGSSQAKDSNVRQALIDILGKPGTKKEPGPTYGVKSHAWQALGVAVVAAGVV